MSSQAPRPLAKLGNTCYLNVVLQVLARYRSLKHYFVDSAPPENEGILTEAFRAYMCAQWDSKRKNAVLSPAKLLEKVAQRNERFKGRQQQDSHEVLRIILETIIEEESKRVGEKGRSPLVDLLQGKLVSSIVCRSCKNRSERLEPFLDISLSLVISKSTEELSDASIDQSSTKQQKPPPHPPPFACKWSSPRTRTVVPQPPEPPRKSRLARNKANTYKSIEGCLEEYTKTEGLELENAYWCDECTRRKKVAVALSQQVPKLKNPLAQLSRSEEDNLLKRHQVTIPIVKTSADRRTMLREVPDVLIFYLVRFQQLHGLIKITGHVPFPVILDISAFTDSSVAERNQSQRKYALVGVTKHGGSLSNGHYTNFVRANVEYEVDGKWYFCNDDRIKQSSKQNMLQSEAYILFYERVRK